ncbi:MAG TPA: response regulator [Thermodesulfobacteriota bacterium]|nr:response regulator [Thermodesulfobacteriota bacterium]
MSGSSRRRRRPVVLVADDQETPILVTRKILGEEAFDFVVARDGREAVEKARTVRPDLILLDVEMPELDGLAAARALRADPATTAIPIIMVTARSDEASLEQAYLRGCVDYIVKPIRAEELVAKVRSVLP